MNNVWEHLLVLGFRGDPYWRHNLPNQPMLNPWQAFFFWLGVGMAVWRWQERPAYRLLILWLVRDDPCQPCWPSIPSFQALHA